MTRVFKSSEATSLYRMGAIGGLLILISFPMLGEASWLEILPVAAPLLFMYWRFLRASVRTDEEGVTVINPLRTYAFGWDDLERFELRSNPIFQNDRAVAITSKGEIPIFAIQANNSFIRKRKEEEVSIVEELNQLIRVHSR